jgi:hypothetical protein
MTVMHMDLDSALDVFRAQKKEPHEGIQ